MLDVGGQDSTEAFEDVGHSDEAREILEGLLVGTLKREVRLLFSRYTALPHPPYLLSFPTMHTCPRSHVYEMPRQIYPPFKNNFHVPSPPETLIHPNDSLNLLPNISDPPSLSSARV